MPSCCYWLLYRRWLGRSLVYRRILVKADTKPQRHRLTKQQPDNNIRNDQILHRGCTVGFTVKSPRIQIITPQLVLLLELHYQSATVLHRGTYWDYATTYAAPTYDTEAPAYYITKAVEFYTGAPKYDRNQSSELLRHPTRQPRSFE
jgi:hypothetical protein